MPVTQLFIIHFHIGLIIFYSGIEYTKNEWNRLPASRSHVPFLPMSRCLSLLLLFTLHLACENPSSLLPSDWWNTITHYSKNVTWELEDTVHGREMSSKVAESFDKV